jgi:hypothetical protein
MMVVEVAEKKWEEFCSRVEESCRDALMNIYIIHPGEPATTVARELPLLRMSLDDKSDRCNTNLVIEAGRQGRSQVTHAIIEPIHIRLENGRGTDRYHRLVIVAENGITVIEVHPGVSPDLVEGLNLGRERRASNF